MDWVKTFGGTGVTSPWSSGVDSQGNIYTGGIFSGTVDFDSGTGTDIHTAPAGGNGFFVKKVDANGNHLWARTWGDGVGVTLNVLEVANDGAVYIGGWFRGASMDFDPGTGVYNLNGAPGSLDRAIYLMKLDAQGNFKWANSRNGFAEITNIERDSVGRFYVCGNYKSSFDKDPNPANTSFLIPTSAGSYDGFIERFDTSGVQIWCRALAGSGNTWLHDINVNAKNEPVLVGSFSGSTDFDVMGSTNVVNPTGDYDGFLLHLQKNGTFVSVDVFESSGLDKVFALNIERDSDQNYYVAGYFDGQVDFDPGSGNVGVSFGGSGPDDGRFIVKLDSNHNFQWRQNYQGGRIFSKYTPVGNIQSLFIDENTSSFYLAGSYYEDMTVIPGDQTSQLTIPGGTSWKGFITKHELSGQALWQQDYGSTYCRVVSLMKDDSDESVIVTGYFNDSSGFDPYNPSLVTYSIGSRDGFLLKLNGCNIGLDQIDSVYACDEYTHPTLGLIDTDTLITEWFQGANNCDSVVNTKVTIEESITPTCLNHNLATLRWSGSYLPDADFYWYDCNNDSIVEVGQIGQRDFYPAYNGNFAVIVEHGACMDTSVCYSVQGVGLEEEILIEVDVYPNPTSHVLNLENLTQKGTITLYNLSGKLLLQKAFKGESAQLDLSSLPKGVYLLELKSENDGRIFRKVMKE
ncbi:T9SS type A sorting domain-containing protein [Owenweeksia hongkongensis]|uniref:T9SS type A sorting domain-containing protein n=1 Tax=Owenweeksia hongkongensis TaxID=253245 RepID=UPI003A936727